MCRPYYAQPASRTIVPSTVVDAGKLRINMSQPKARLTQDQIKSLLKKKGWTQKGVAECWGYSERWISELIKNTERRIMYDHAFLGLPDKK